MVRSLKTALLARRSLQSIRLLTQKRSQCSLPDHSSDHDLEQEVSFRIAHFPFFWDLSSAHSLTGLSRRCLLKARLGPEPLFLTDLRLLMLSIPIWCMFFLQFVVCFSYCSSQFALVIGNLLILGYIFVYFGKKLKLLSRWHENFSLKCTCCLGG